MIDLIGSAFRVAARAHEGQADKAGEAYISHPSRIAARLLCDGHRDQIVAAGLLHDVVEDSGISIDQLRHLGFPEDVLEIVEALSRREGERPDAYYARVKAVLGAVLVKDYDIDDNSDPHRIKILRLLGFEELADRLVKKYVKAKAAIR